MEYKDANALKIDTIKYSVTDCMSSIQLVMTTGDVQPDIGLDYLVDREVRVKKLMEDMIVKHITKIKVRSKEHSHIEGFAFWSKNIKGEEVEVFRTDYGENETGIETVYELEDGEKIVGVYGITNSTPVL